MPSQAFKLISDAHLFWVNSKENLSPRVMLRHAQRWYECKNNAHT